jgi:hypothetical protein
MTTHVNKHHKGVNMPTLVVILNRWGLTYDIRGAIAPKLCCGKHRLHVDSQILILGAAATQVKLVRSWGFGCAGGNIYGS